MNDAKKAFAHVLAICMFLKLQCIKVSLSLCVSATVDVCFNTYNYILVLGVEELFVSKVNLTYSSEDTRGTHALILKIQQRCLAHSDQPTLTKLVSMAETKSNHIIRHCLFSSVGVGNFMHK